MALYYFDTSALVKRYVSEVGTAWVTRLTDPASGNETWSVRLTGPETIAALSRKARTGEITPADAVRATGEFRLHWQQEYQIVEIDARVADLAMELAERHDLRGYDAVHLAAALQLHRARRELNLPAITFVSADTGQLQTAQAEGLLVENPNNYAWAGRPRP